MRVLTCFAAVVFGAILGCNPGGAPAEGPSNSGQETTGELRSDAASADQLPRSATPAVRAAADACARGQGADCLLVGVSYQGGLGGLTADDAKAADFYQRACDAGHVKGCNNLAVMFEKGEGRAVDSKRAFELYEQTCKAKHALGCRNLGRAHRDGLGTTADKVKAQAAFRMALVLSKSECAAGVAEGCSNLGFMHRSGNEGVPKDEKRATEYLERACAMGYRAVCSRVHSP